MSVLKTIGFNRKTLIISVLGAALFWSNLFLLKACPSFFSPQLKLAYFLGVLFSYAAIGIFGLVSLILILAASLKKKSPGRIWIIGFCLSLSFIVLMPFAFAINRHIPKALPSGSGSRAFNSTLWQSESSTDWNNGISVREQMLGDVVKNILPGKNKQEIESLLGSSLQTGYFDNLDKDLIYYLGPERDGVVNIDSEWLLIWLDENGKFKRYKIAND